MQQAGSLRCVARVALLSFAPAVPFNRLCLLICRFVQSSHPGVGSSFELKTQYPAHTLTNDGQTVKDAQLGNALIIQS